jgi:hypothetical protein
MFSTPQLAAALNTAKQAMLCSGIETLETVARCAFIAGLMTQRVPLVAELRRDELAASTKTVQS